MMLGAGAPPAQVKNHFVYDTRSIHSGKMNFWLFIIFLESAA
jgi:hypothetical protein